jgi:hypothetical protein
MDECGIGEHPTIVALWQKRKRWIATYFKGMYCGRMTSTQRSESQNRVLKDGYVGSVTTLHMFAKRVLDSVQHTDHMDAGESHYSQVFLKTLLVQLLQRTGFMYDCKKKHMSVCNN